MAKILFVLPWVYHDENRQEYNAAQEWRCGPYNVLVLATMVKKAGHTVQVVDLQREVVRHRGNVDAALNGLAEAVAAMAPDIIGFSFFSVHYFEVRRAVTVARETCRRHGLSPMFIAGGIHASIDPQSTIEELGFDYAFNGEGELGMLALANGAAPSSVPGVITRDMLSLSGCELPKGQQVKNLDDLPFPDWSLCDYQFYAAPSYARLKVRKTGSLDLMMGRGCVYRCTFCAYNALSAVRFNSAEYLVDQVARMAHDYGVDSVYFLDSTIGNNRKLIVAFCEEMLKRGLEKRVSWMANIRSNQVNRELLTLMRRAGCCYLFYGFDSNSQKVLDLMSKGCRVEHNEMAAQLHNDMLFPYNASFIAGFPGETEEDFLESLSFIERYLPPSVGVNWYVPLPGSPDYDALREKGIITTKDPVEWRRIGECNPAVNRNYSAIPDERFRELFARATNLANGEVPLRLKELGRNFY